jgi:conjugal transfer pilus assembly protein TraK
MSSPSCSQSAARGLLLAASVTLVGLAPTLQADSPFLRGSLGAKGSAGDTNAAEPAMLALGPRTVTVAPGANAILELAIDHLNRIVTPFERPSVRTVSDVSTEVEGNVVYVATASEAPATLYISASDAARTTVALTLAPRRVPPREIRLTVPGYQTGQANPATKPVPETESGSAVAEVAVSPARWQQPLPYLQTLTSAFRTLALGEDPEGFRKRSPRFGERLRCAATGLRASDVRIYEGEHVRFITATLRATGKDALAIDQGSCRPGGKARIAAQASWPRTRLERGQETRLLLALRMDGPTPKRPANAAAAGGER